MLTYKRLHRSYLDVLCVDWTKNPQILLVWFERMTRQPYVDNYPGRALKWWVLVVAQEKPVGIFAMCGRVLSLAHGVANAIQIFRSTGHICGRL